MVCFLPQDTFTLRSPDSVFLQGCSCHPNLTPQATLGPRIPHSGFCILQFSPNLTTQTTLALRILHSVICRHWPPQQASLHTPCAPLICALKLQRGSARGWCPWQTFAGRRASCPTPPPHGSTLHPYPTRLITTVNRRLSTCFKTVITTSEKPLIIREP